MASGIIICKATGGQNLTGIAASQTIAAGGGTFTINGSLATGGVATMGTKFGRKVIVSSAATLTSAMICTLTGEFFASASTGATTVTMAIAGSNTSTMTGALYAVSVSNAVMSTTTAGLYTIGVTSDGQGQPVTLHGANTYEIVYGGTFGAATFTVQGYDEDLAEWSALDSGATSASRVNYELPNPMIVRGVQAGASTTTALGIVAHPINRR